MQKKLFFLFLIIRNVTVHQFILIVLSLNIPEVPHTTPPKKKFYIRKIPAEHTCIWCWKDFLDLQAFMNHLDTHKRKDTLFNITILVLH